MVGGRTPTPCLICLLGLTLGRYESLMHGVAPHMCCQVGRPLSGRGAGGRSPGYLPAERLAVGLLAYVLMGSALGRTGAAPTPKSNRLVQWPHTPNLRQPQRRRFRGMVMGGWPRGPEAAAAAAMPAVGTLVAGSDGLAWCESCNGSTQGLDLTQPLRRVTAVSPSADFSAPLAAICPS
jgi:hypothetical protein